MDTAPVVSTESIQKFSRNNFLVHHDTHPLTLILLCIERMGTDWMDWEPDVLRSELLRTFRQPSIYTGNWEMVQAGRTCLLTVSPWKAWEVFVLVCHAFNNNIPDFQNLQRPTPAQIAACVDTMHRLGSHEFSNDVERFIAAVFLDESIDYLPPLLSFAQEWVSSPMYRCRRCGKVDHDDDNGVCDSCGAPDTELEKGNVNDPEPVRKRYEAVLALGEDRPELQETPEDVQTAKLLLVKEYVEYRRRQLEEQLAVVREELP